jgi:hypothetical protein
MFLSGSLAFLPLSFRKSPPLPDYFFGKPPSPLFWLWSGLAAGGLLSFAAMLQFQGMVWTTSGKSAFITSLYMVMVPLMALAIGRVPGRTVWAGLFLGVLGLNFLSGVRDGDGFNTGDALTLAADVFWASHLILVSRCANRVDAIRFVTVQTGVTAAVCLAIAFARGSVPDWGRVFGNIASLFGRNRRNYRQLLGPELLPKVLEGHGDGHAVTDESRVRRLFRHDFSQRVHDDIHVDGSGAGRLRLPRRPNAVMAKEPPLVLPGSPESPRRLAPMPIPAAP